MLQFKSFIFKKLNQSFIKKFSTTIGNINLPPIDITKLLTMHDVRDVMLKKLGLNKLYNASPEPRDYLLKYEPKLEDLPPRKMQDSFTSVLIPLCKQPELQLKYMSNFASVIRKGRLLEDIDLFAVWICHKHLHIPKLDPNIPLPYTFVTILVDNGEFFNYTPKKCEDIIISGHVSWVSRSTMEIIILAGQIDDSNKFHETCRIIFLMAARNAINTKAAPINPLSLTNDIEKNIFNCGNEHKKKRIESIKTSIFNIKPNDIEANILFDIFKNTISDSSMILDQYILPDTCHWMGNTKIIQTTPCYPSKLNVQNTVFGGYLIRIALETSLICSNKFCGKYPHLININEIIFREPIYVKSFIEMTSHVIYTHKTYLQILTTADIYEADSTFDKYDAKTKTTNIFHLTFDTKDCEKLKKVTPRTYKEAMCYLEGKRKLESCFNNEED